MLGLSDASGKATVRSMALRTERCECGATKAWLAEHKAAARIIFNDVDMFSGKTLTNVV